MESMELAPKVKATYQAVIDLFKEGADLNNLTVSEITARAGIGKGTAYEYFSNKEEMIAGALFYELKEECRSLSVQLKQEMSLYDKMNVVLISMEEKMSEINCFVRAIHVLMDNSAVSSKMRQMVEAKKEDDVLIMDIIQLVLEQEMGAGNELKNEEKVCLAMTVLSRMICFVLYQFDQQNKTGIDSAVMRKMICRDVCRDVEYYRQKLH